MFDTELCCHFHFSFFLFRLLLTGFYCGGRISHVSISEVSTNQLEEYFRPQYVHYVHSLPQVYFMNGLSLSFCTILMEMSRTYVTNVFIPK